MPIEAQRTDLLREVEKCLAAWKRRFYFFWTLHYCLGAGGSIIAIAVAGRLSFMTGGTLEIFALSAGIATALLTFFVPSRQAITYNEAWVIASNAYLKYKMGECNATELLDALEKGERVILSKVPS